MTVISIETSVGRPVNACESFNAAFVVGDFDTLGQMRFVNDCYKGHTALSVDEAS